MKEAAHLSFVVACRVLTLATKRIVERHKCWQHMPVRLGGGYIFAGNHPTSLDPIYVCDLIRRPVILATEFVFGLPFVGWMFEGMDCIPVPIREEDPRRHQAYLRALNALYQGRNLLVAPEGKMSQDAATPKSGIARLSRQAGKAIVPIGIRHFGKVYTFHLGLNGHRQKIRWMPCGITKVRIGAPMSAHEGESPIETVNRVMHEIRELSII